MMFKKMMGEQYSCGLDIGAQSIRAAIVRNSNGDQFELMGVYSNKTYGYKGSSITDLSELSECINHIIKELSRRVGVKIREINLGINSQLIISRKTETAIPLVDKGSKVITNRDVKKLHNHSRLLGIKMEEEILHNIAQGYKVDDLNSAENPVGLYGRKLEVSSMLLLSNVNSVRNLSKAVHQAGYEISSMSFSSYIASDIVLTEKNRKIGCVLIDVGSRNTNILIFKDDVLHFMKTISLGGDNFTDSIASVLNLPFSLADEIKKSYAVATSADLYPEEEILVKKDNEYIPVKKDVICAAIEPNMQSLEQQVKDAINNSNLYDGLNDGITVIGGGALLPGLIERIGMATGLKIRSGKNNIHSKKHLSDPVLFSSVVGLAKYGFTRYLKKSDKKKNKISIIKVIGNKVKELYQEYF